jgi:hypothetical protein
MKGKYMNTPKLLETNQPAPSDTFDLESLRLDQSFVEAAGVKKIITTVPVRRPSPQHSVRVHPSPEYRGDFPVIQLKEENETYLVRPEVYPELAGELIHITLYTTVSRQGAVSLWPVRLPAPDDRRNDWHRSAREAAMAASKWLRLTANRHLGAYEIHVALGATFVALMGIGPKDEVKPTKHFGNLFTILAGRTSRSRTDRRVGGGGRVKGFPALAAPPFWVEEKPARRGATRAITSRGGFHI